MFRKGLGCSWAVSILRGVPILKTVRAGGRIINTNSSFRGGGGNKNLTAFANGIHGLLKRWSFDLLKYLGKALGVLLIQLIIPVDVFKEFQSDRSVSWGGGW